MFAAFFILAIVSKNVEDGIKSDLLENIKIGHKNSRKPD